MNKVNSIYVVDDDKIYHYLLKNLLKQNNIDVLPVFFTNGQDAIEALQSKQNPDEIPDLILLDVNMPIMDGWQFLEEYVKIEEKLPKSSVIFMISSSNDEQDINTAKNYIGVVKDYLLKPICKEDLDKIFIADEV